MADFKLDSLPDWAPFAIIGGVVLLLVMSQRSSGDAASGIGNVTTLAPAPADPNVISAMNAETEARSQGFSDLVGLFGTRIQSDRDVQISSLNADIQNKRTAAELAASEYSQSVRQTLGLAATSASVSIEKSRADAAVRITDSQGATQKYVAKKSNNPLNHLIDGAASVIGHIFGRH